MRTAKTVALRLLTGILIILPPAAVLRIILKYGQNIPWIDQWDIPGKILISHIRGTLSLADFFQTQNECVRAFTGLVWFLMARTGWKPRTEMILTWMITVAAAAILGSLLDRTLKTTPPVKRTMFALMVLFLFHPHGTEHWLTGLNLENALLLLLLSTGLLVNSSAAPTWLKYLLAGGFSLVATFSFSNGVLLWLLICPLLFTSLPPGKKEQHRTKIALPGMAYLAAGLICLFSYYSIIAASPQKSSQIDLDFANPMRTFTFLLNWLGAPFRIPTLPWATIGIASLFLFLLLIALLSFIRRVEQKDVKTLLPWLILALYSLITGVAVALARSGFGPTTAFSPRYFLHQVLLPIALLPLTVMALQTLADTRRRKRLNLVLFRSLAGLVALFCTISVISQWTNADVLARNTARKRSRGAVALSYMDVIPRNPDLTFLNPSAAVLKSRARILIHHEILDLPLHKQPPVGENRPREVLIDGLKLELSEDESILATGSCPNTHAAGEISYILLSSFHGDRSEKAFAVFKPKDSRYQEQVERNTATESHFSRHLSTVALKPGRHLLKAWIYDSTSREYTPLANEWMINIDSDGLFFLNGASSERGEGQGGIP